jgi:hypothetical protein
MEYKIVTAFDTDSLEWKVNSLLKEGWEPVGGPFKEDGEWRGDFCQALIKND